jgi:hypothetical protein
MTGLRSTPRLKPVPVALDVEHLKTELTFIAESGRDRNEVVFIDLECQLTTSRRDARYLLAEALIYPSR